MANGNGSSSGSQVAIVTGAAGQIGAAACRRLVADGFLVLGVDVDVDTEPAAKLAADLGGALVLHTADVGDEAAVQGYVAAAQALGDVRGFFNNAGVEGAVAPIVQSPADAFDALVRVNVRGVFLGLKHVMTAMAVAGAGGSIVNTASVAGMIGYPGIGPYVASKHAVIGLTKTAALEGAAAGIRVNAVCPGPIEGRMMTSLEAGAAPMLGTSDLAEVRAAMTALIPGGRYGTPAEVADLVAFLLSERASYISGAAMPIDWAFTAQ